MEEILEHGMTDYEQLGWLLDNENMEILTLEETEDKMIDMLVWASGEHYMKEEREEMPDKEVERRTAESRLQMIRLQKFEKIE
ncbi:hypothetical protein LWI29_019111 [Acer saccharum]|uniref:Uncharacterized protein n=1 Tax=Acer saccharum TaxID=4024 RepID=A0AA39SUA0_ACESA|nr:hypothetical protein LWI29_019111 [Acer saccharum]